MGGGGTGGGGAGIRTHLTPTFLNPFRHLVPHFLLLRIHTAAPYRGTGQGVQTAAGPHAVEFVVHRLLHILGRAFRMQLPPQLW
jgi:hypothetical protein